MFFILSLHVKPSPMKASKQLIAIAISLVAAAPLFAQTADYGDAPDGGTFNGMPLNYNSLAASQGPRHTSAGTTTFWIANNKNLLAPDTENDSRQVNQDIDNGQPFIFVYLLGIPAPTKVTVPVVTSPSHNPNTTLYLNVAVDVDDDFDYENNPDVNWVVRNQPFNMPADTTLGIVSDWFGFGSNLMLFPVWLRATVTDVPVASGWNDGSTANTYGNGETEDWFYTFGRGGSSYPPTWGNPPRDPGDTLNMKKKGKKPKKPKSSKCAKMYYPRVVYVHCGKIKCFNIIVKNCNGDTLKDVGLDFKFKSGNPLPGPPSQVGGNIDITSGKSGKFLVCVTGWPCDPQIENRWARYDIKLKYDPDGLYEETIGELVFGSHETPFIDTTFQTYLGVEPLIDTVDSPIWDAEVGTQMNYHLVAFTGRYDFGLRWITGKPILVPKRLPPWAALVETGITLDSTFYTVTGTPPLNAPGIDTIILTATSDLSVDSLTMTPKDFIFPLHTTMQNSPPVLDSTFPTLVTLSAGQTITQTIKASDPDIMQGRRDTIFIDYYFYDPVADTVVTPVTSPTFTDNGDGTASFSWTPGLLDVGIYELVAVAWDYSMEEVTSTTTMTVFIGVDDPTRLDPVLGQNIPNPFNGRSTITFALPRGQQVSIEVLNLNGEVIQMLAEGYFESGKHSVEWRSGELPSGTYVYRLKTLNGVAYRKAVIIK